MDLVKTWENYYAELKGDTAIKDRNFFRLEVEALIGCVRQAALSLPDRKPIRILELGSGTGFLASRILESLEDFEMTYVGVDFSNAACEKATKRNLRNARFLAQDYFDFFESTAQEFDIVLSQRSIMALLDPAQQDSLLDLIHEHMAPSSYGFFSEGVNDGLKQINVMRKQLKLEASYEKVWHSRYMERSQFERVFGQVDAEDFSSLYWLITRVIYPYFEEPKHNTVLHDFAASLPQTGTYSSVKLFKVRK